MRGGSAQMREIVEAVIVPPAGRHRAGRLDMAVLEAGGRLVPEAVCRTEKVTSEGFAPDPAAPAAQARLAGTWLFGGIASHHFGHQITRSLGRLHALATAVAPRGLVFVPLDRRALTPASVAGFRRLLDGLGIALPVRIVTQPTTVARLLVAPDLFGEGRGGEADPAYVAWARRSVLPPGPGTDPERRLYVTRARLGPGAGRLLCEEVLEANLAALGFEIYVPEAHPVRDQLAAYAGAGTIVTSDGSQGHLIAFARQSGQRIAILARRAGRPALLLRHLDSFGAGLEGSAVHYLQRVTAEWWPETRADNVSLAEIDFSGLAHDLAAAGIIPGEAVTRWRVPAPGDIAGAKALAVPGGARLLSDAERAAFLRARRRRAPAAAALAAAPPTGTFALAEAPAREVPPAAAPPPAKRRRRRAALRAAADGADPAAAGPVRGMRYLSFLKALHERLRPVWYLEVGTFKGRSLRLAACNYVAVDPAFRLSEVPPLGGQETIFFRDTSDAFFAGATARRLRGRIDLAFLDGLLHYEVLLRDVIGVEPLMAPGGMVVLHNCLPSSPKAAGRDHTPHLDWAGDVWKTLLILQRERPDLRIDVLDCAPTGLVVLRGFDPARGRALRRRFRSLRAEWDPLSLADLPGGLDGFHGRLALQSGRAFLAGLGG